MMATLIARLPRSAGVTRSRPPMPLRRTLALAGWALACCAAIPALAQVSVNARNDYFAAQGTQELKVVEQYHLGPCERLLRQREFTRSIEECAFILRIFPNHPQALLLTSQACVQSGSPRCLLDDLFESAIAINPRAAGTFIVQGIYQHRAVQYPKAIQSFTFALKLDPNSMNAHYNLGLTYLETRQFELANAHAQRAYALGASLPGLRDRLRAANHWDPSKVSSDASGTDRSAAADGKAAGK
jgi:tetratricopeptide (TPR) repeat protein